MNYDGKKLLLVNKNRHLYFYVKRMLDLVLSLFLLLLSLPIILFFGILIKIESKGGVFYSQERIGYLGKEIKIIKLRSMTKDAEKNGPQWAKKFDSRVTKVGAFIRKTRIDELPQLLNVVKGDMSLIGPRPERKIFIDEFLKTIPNFNDRLQVLPGLSGLAQVNGGYNITPQEKLILDLKYIENYGFQQDLKICLKTIKVIFSGDGAR